MADNVAVTPGTGATIAADEVTDGTLGTVKVQYVKIMDGTIDGTTKNKVLSNGGIAVSLADKLAGEDLTNDYQKSAPQTDHSNGNLAAIYGPTSVAGSATQNTASQDPSQYRKVGFVVFGDGTHTLQAKLQVSEDGSNWADLTSLTSAAACVAQVADVCNSHVRVQVVNGSTTQNVTVNMVLHK